MNSNTHRNLIETIDHIALNEFSHGLGGPFTPAPPNSLVGATQQEVRQKIRDDINTRRQARELPGAGHDRHTKRRWKLEDWAREDALRDLKRKEQEDLDELETQKGSNKARLARRRYDDAKRRVGSDNGKDKTWDEKTPDEKIIQGYEDAEEALRGTFFGRWM